MLDYNILIECNLNKNKCVELIKKRDQFTSTKRTIEENNFWSTQ